MYIDQNACIGCGVCLKFCPVGAISIINRKAFIDEKLCMECGTCGRNNIVKCPKEAIHENSDVYEVPRSISKYFSDPMAYHPETKVPGRGTEEVKTNDVTGRFKRGYVGIGIEVGRPSVSTSFKDVEIITKALCELDYINFEKDNPLFHLMKDPNKGIFYDHVRPRRALSAIIEFAIPIEKMDEVIRVVMSVSNEIDTVFSLEVITRLENGKVPDDVKQNLANIGLEYRPNAKVNLGLGKPLKED